MFCAAPNPNEPPAAPLFSKTDTSFDAGLAVARSSAVAVEISRDNVRRTIAHVESPRAVSIKRPIAQAVQNGDDAGLIRIESVAGGQSQINIAILIEIARHSRRRVSAETRSGIEPLWRAESALSVADGNGSTDRT